VGQASSLPFIICCPSFGNAMIETSLLSRKSVMLSAVWGVVRDGKVETLQPSCLPEGARVLLTVMHDEDEDVIFWRRLSEESLKKIWDNPEDDVYAELLKR
jgi:hypothetical protein